MPGEQIEKKKKKCCISKQLMSICSWMEPTFIYYFIKSLQDPWNQRINKGNDLKVMVS